MGSGTRPGSGKFIFVNPAAGCFPFFLEFLKKDRHVKSKPLLRLNLHTNLAHEVSFVTFDGVLGTVEYSRHILVSPALGDQKSDLFFTRRKFRGNLLVFLLLPAAPHQRYRLDAPRPSWESPLR